MMAHFLFSKMEHNKYIYFKGFFQISIFFRMFTLNASRKQHKFIPIISNFSLPIWITARPVFFQIMEHCFPRMVRARILLLIFLICKCTFNTTLISANKSSIFIFFSFLHNFRNNLFILFLLNLF